MDMLKTFQFFSYQIMSWFYLIYSLSMQDIFGSWTEYMHSQNEKKWNVLKKTSKKRFMNKELNWNTLSVHQYQHIFFLIFFFSIYNTYICTYTLLTSNMMLTPFLCSTEKHLPFIHFYLDSFIFPFFYPLWFWKRQWIHDDKL